MPFLTARPLPRSAPMMTTTPSSSPFTTGFLHSDTQRRLSRPLRRVSLCSNGGGGGNNFNIHGSGGGDGEEEQGSGPQKKWLLVRVSSDVQSQIETQLGKGNIFDIAGISTIGESSSESSTNALKYYSSNMTAFGLMCTTLMFAYVGLRDIVEVSQDYLADMKKHVPNDEVSQDYSADIKKRDTHKS